MQPFSEPPAAAEPCANASNSFLIGQDEEGHWLAIQANRLRGGIFVNKDAAVHYARDESHGADNALHIVAGPLKL